MKPVWLALSTSGGRTCIVAMRGSQQTILRAQLCPYPASIRATTILLEAIALWEGTSVHAAVVVDESSTSSLPMMLYREAFAAFGESTPLYQIEWIPRAAHHDESASVRRGEADSAHFDDLECLLSQCVAR